MSGSALLCCLVLLAGVEACQAHGTPYENSCAHFQDNLPHRLQELRLIFGRVKVFFQTRDRLSSVLLSQSLKDDIKGYLGCQALSEMIKFYLEEVMPQAVNQGPAVREHVNSLGEKLESFRRALRRCHRFLPCENKSHAVEQMKTVFTKLQEKGVYKAMSEFDIFIKCMEDYITMKIQH